MWSIIKKIRRPVPAEPSEKPADSRAAVRLWLEREEASLLTAIDRLGRTGVSHCSAAAKCGRGCYRYLSVPQYQRSPLPRRLPGRGRGAAGGRGSGGPVGQGPAVGDGERDRCPSYPGRRCGQRGAGRAAGPAP